MNGITLKFRRIVHSELLKAKRLLRLDSSFNDRLPSDIPIDVFMPTLEKDADVLPSSIKSIRKYVKHPITAIYIVAPRNASLVKEIANKLKCEFIPEDSVLGFGKSKIKYSYKGEDRSGWIFKMLLNLYADSICNEKNILIVDSDIVFIRPQIFIHRNKPIFNLSPYYHQPYYDANKRLIDLDHYSSLSFITHYMLFNADVLKSLRDHIETKTHKNWHEAIIDNLDTSILSCFADYEIYGDYYVNRLRKPWIKNYWMVYDSQKSEVSTISGLTVAKNSRYGAIGMHNYNRE